MTKISHYIAAGLAVLVVAIGSFALGSKSQHVRNEQFEVELASTQAMLWFNHLLRFRQLEDYLSRGCSAEALEKVRISIAEEMTLLASFYQEYEDTQLNEYISLRDPTLLGQLEGYKSKYGTSWTEPQCWKPAL